MRSCIGLIIANTVAAVAEFVDIFEIRRFNLRAQAEKLGGPARLADALDKSESQISQIIGVNFKRNVGPRLARQIEKKLKIKEFTLDIPPPPYTELVLRVADELSRRHEEDQQKILDLILRIPTNPSKGVERRSGR